MFSVAKMLSQKSQTKGALRRAAGGEWGSLPSVRPTPLSSQIHRQMLLVERQVPVVFKLISRASLSLGTVGEAQIRGQVTEAPCGAQCQDGPPPHCSSSRRCRASASLLLSSVICAVWHGNQVRERGRGKGRHVAYFEPFPGTGLHLVRIHFTNVFKCPLCAQPAPRKALQCSNTQDRPEPLPLPF